LNAGPGAAESKPGPLFFVFGKILPSALFAVLALLQLDLFRLEAPSAFSHFPEIASISFFFNRLLSIGFASGIALVYIVRRPPLRGRHDIGAVFVAMYASFVLLALRPVIEFMAIEVEHFPAWSVILANVLIAVGAGFSIYSLLYLRLNFSILPEARGLTTSGPYRLVRHPVYLGEILGALGFTIALPSLFSVLVLISFVGSQLLRTRMEEAVLTAQLPGYVEYMATTPRLIPFVKN
jgi:protein-S-isoprenylcysteine O-methyltransferase Ste14